VILARVLGYIEAFDISADGRVYFPDLVREIAKNFRFQKFPQTLEEHDLKKGVEFLEGKIGDRTIQKFVIWDSLIVLETRINTDESKAILEEMLLWGTAKFGLTYSPGMIKRFAYISDVTFYSDVPFLSVSPLLTGIATTTSKALSDIWQEPIHYEPFNLVIGHDPAARKYGIAPFSITRRAESRFSDNKYFSEAPLPTDIHISLLEEYEAGIKELHGLTKEK
jgi:hypothetical protein